MCSSFTDSFWVMKLLDLNFALCSVGTSITAPFNMNLWNTEDSIRPSQRSKNTLCSDPSCICWFGLPVNVYNVSFCKVGSIFFCQDFKIFSQIFLFFPCLFKKKKKQHKAFFMLYFVGIFANTFSWNVLRPLAPLKCQFTGQGEVRSDCTGGTQSAFPGLHLGLITLHKEFTSHLPLSTLTMPHGACYTHADTQNACFDVRAYRKRAVLYILRNVYCNV